MKKHANTINALNGVKGWFIFLVVIFHTFNGNGLLANILSPIKSYGGYIVNYLFFMLSGFLTAYSFSNKKISDRKFLDYIKSKLIKFYPLYLITNLWQFGYFVFVNGIGAISLSKLLMVLTMQTGGTLTDLYPYNVPCWFLCTLMVCYIIHYFIRFLCKNDLNKYIWFFYIFFILGIILETHNIDFPFLFVHDGEGFANFFLGCIIFEHYRLFRDKKIILYILWIGVLLCLIIPSAKVLIGDVRYLITFIFCPVLILLALEESIFRKIFNCKLSQLLGKISMGIFFIHTIKPLSSIPLCFNNYNVGYAMYILVIIVLSALSTFLIGFIIKKKRKISYNLSYNSLYRE